MTIGSNGNGFPAFCWRNGRRIFGQDFVHQVKAMGIKQMLSVPRSPWQRAYVERVIGTIRCERLDHVIATALDTKPKAVTEPF